MSRILEGLDGVLCQMDDVLIHGRDETEHNTRVIAALKRIEAAGVTLNRDKCEFGKPCLKFLGHVLDQDGIRADPEKTSAITQMRAPTTVTELRRFLGMANQLGKFTPRLAELTQPLRELLSKSNAWVWGPPQQQAFAAVKRELSTPTTLAFYDPDAPTKVSADASSYGVGAVLLQELDSHWKPVAYASRSMNDTERRYAQIEKEALAVTWACERFSTYILGKTFEIETDHKPLVPLLGAKHLDSLPPRILRFRLRMDWFSYSINHVSGKSLCTADALSRAPTSPPTQEDSTHAVLAELVMESQISHLPASPETLNRFQKGQHSDSLLTSVKTYCRNGWPDQAPTQRDLRLYWEARGQLTLHGDLLLYDGRVVVPETLRDETLSKLHGGHQGIQRCRTRARSSVWWPGLSQQIGKFVKNCTVCAKNATPNKEPLMASPLPDYPWQKVGTDLLSLNGVDYLIVVDYFSRYPEVVKLTTVTSQSVIRALRSLFARHGIPEYVASDNGPQYSSQEFSDFAKTYGFSHVCSSPYYPQSNGQVERAVKTVKQLIKDSDDPCLSMLAYRTTPLPWCGVSPSELLMGRQLRSDLPLTTAKLTPQWPYLSDFRARNQEFKERQKRDFDQRHRVKELPDLPDDTEVFVTTGGRQTTGRVVRPAVGPRSYVVETPNGQITRNRSQLNIVPTTDSNTPPTSTSPQHRSPIQTRSRTGTRIVPPERLF